MQGKIQSWPESIDSTNWHEVEPIDLNDHSNPVLSGFSEVLQSIKAALIAAEDPKIYSEIGFELPFSEMIGIWTDLLRRIRYTSITNIGVLQAGQWIYNGNQVPGWVPNFDNSQAQFVITNDPYLLGDAIRQRDFGKLFELGKQLRLLKTLTFGGRRSPLTKAAINDIEAVGEQQIKGLKDKVDKATKEAVATLKTAKTVRSWSGHYDTRVEELEKKVADLTVWRRWWYTAVMLTLVIYGAAAVLVATGKIELSKLSTIQGLGKYLMGLTFYGFLLGVFLGYSFCTRQLKIHQNLLEQYRHRAVVARTIEGVVGAVVRSQADNADTEITQQELQELVKVAAIAMFEYRPIGHLSAKESTSPIMEVVNTFKG